MIYKCTLVKFHHYLNHFNYVLTSIFHEAINLQRKRYYISSCSFNVIKKKRKEKLKCGFPKKLKKGDDVIMKKGEGLLS